MYWFLLYWILCPHNACAFPLRKAMITFGYSRPLDDAWRDADESLRSDLMSNLMSNLMARAGGGADRVEGGGADREKNSVHCEYWASIGECKTNPGFMLNICAEFCSHAARCEEYFNIRQKENVRDFSNFSKMFYKIVDEYPHLSPKIVSHSPPILYFDNFISPETCKAFIELGKNRYKPSVGVHVENGKYIPMQTNMRTSLNTWCDYTKCLTYATQTTELLSNMTSIPSKNFEYAQMLYYFPCDDEKSDACSFYRHHHDFIPEDVYKPQGPRILTLLIYLNDVEEGGATIFDANVSVLPRQGRAVLWPNVKNSNFTEQDPRTFHEAKPVLKGSKYAINFWIHLYDFKSPHFDRCT